MYVYGIRRLFVFGGYIVTKISMTNELVQVNLRRDGRLALKCPSCGATMGVNRTKLQTARDLPMGTARTVLILYEAVQGRCSACGAWATIHPDGIDDHARATRRLMEFVSRLARHLPLSSVLEIVGVDDATAYRWDKAVLERKLPPPNLDDLRILLIDEKAVRKHHSYVTLVMNGQPGELLHMWHLTKYSGAGTTWCQSGMRDQAVGRGEPIDGPDVRQDTDGGHNEDSLKFVDMLRLAHCPWTFCMAASIARMISCSLTRQFPSGPMRAATSWPGSSPSKDDLFESHGGQEAQLLGG